MLRKKTKRQKRRKEMKNSMVDWIQEHSSLATPSLAIPLNAVKKTKNPFSSSFHFRGQRGVKWSKTNASSRPRRSCLLSFILHILLPFVSSSCCSRTRNLLAKLIVTKDQVTALKLVQDAIGASEAGDAAHGLDQVTLAASDLAIRLSLTILSHVRRKHSHAHGARLEDLNHLGDQLSHGLGASVGSLADNILLLVLAILAGRGGARGALALGTKADGDVGLERGVGANRLRSDVDSVVIAILESVGRVAARGEEERVQLGLREQSS